MIPQTQINLRLEPDSFKVLLDSVAIAQWVVCAGEKHVEKSYCEEVDRLQQSLLCEAKASGFTDIVCHDEEDQQRLCHHWFGEGQSEAWQAIEDHDEEVFWEELVWRIAPLMAMRIVGISRWQDLDEEEREQRICACEQQVRAVIDRHGLCGVMLTTAEAAG